MSYMTITITFLCTFADKYDALRTEEDVHVLTGALKLFLRELSEPIFPQCMHREFMSAIREPL